MIKKRTLTFICFMVCVTTACMSAPLGDVNDDSGIDIVDALLIAQYYVGLDPANFDSGDADVDCSGEIDIIDALLVAQYYVGLVTSFPCAEPTPGPTPPPQGPGPARALVGYWESWYADTLPLTDVPEEFNMVMVSFAVFESDGTVVFVSYGVQPTQAQINTLKARGQYVILSLGGADSQLTLTSTSHENNFVNSVINIVETYGYNGIDIDMEHGLTVSGTPTNPGGSVQYLINALIRIKNHFGDNFLLTFAPETFNTIGVMSCLGRTFGTEGTWGSYLPIFMEIPDLIFCVHMQHYNSGGMPGADCELHEQNTLDSTIQWAKAMIEGFDIQGTSDHFQGLAPHQVVVGLLGDLGNYSTHKQGFQTLRQEYPAIKGMMIWSINIDRDQGYPFMNTLYNPVINNIF